jgi:hypothetical protein
MQRMRTTNKKKKLLKIPASVVLAALGPSTYHKEYASRPHLLRPSWPSILNSFHRNLRLYRNRFGEYLAGYSDRAYG